MKIIRIIVVVLVVGVLLAVIFPQMQRTDCSPRTSCASNLKQLRLAIYEYADMRKGGRQQLPSGRDVPIHGYQHHPANSLGERFVECLFMGKLPIMRDPSILECIGRDVGVNKFVLSPDEGNFDVGYSSYLYPAIDWTPEAIAASGFEKKDIPLAMDRAGNHEGGANILFMSGLVEFYSNDEFPLGMRYVNPKDPNSPVVDKNGKVILVP